MTGYRDRARPRPGHPGGTPWKGSLPATRKRHVGADIPDDLHGVAGIGPVTHVADRRLIFIHRRTVRDGGIL
jgi:hypothetical protein